MPNLAAFFLNSQSNIVQLETLVISHPSFSQTYYVVRNAMNGITATLEDATTHTFTYYPLQIKRSGSGSDLDSKLEIQLGDLGAIIPNEIDRALAAGTALTKPVCVFRTFRSDDLTAPLDGPFTYELRAIGSKKDSQAFTASAPQLNNNRTGEPYTVQRFPMLAAFL